VPLTYSAEGPYNAVRICCLLADDAVKLMTEFTQLATPLQLPCARKKSETVTSEAEITELIARTSLVRRTDVSKRGSHTYTFR
jgi:hypothetical protein